MKDEGFADSFLACNLSLVAIHFALVGTICSGVVRRDRPRRRSMDYSQGLPHVGGSTRRPVSVLPPPPPAGGGSRLGPLHAPHGGKHGLNHNMLGLRERSG